jgi:hypothetical protein
VVNVPVNGRSPAGELARRDPQLLVTSAMAKGTEAHLHVAPLKLLGEVLYRRVLKQHKATLVNEYVGVVDLGHVHESTWVFGRKPF